MKNAINYEFETYGQNIYLALTDNINKSRIIEQTADSLPLKYRDFYNLEIIKRDLYLIYDAILNAEYNNTKKKEKLQEQEREQEQEQTPPRQEQKQNIIFVILSVIGQIASICCKILLYMALGVILIIGGIFGLAAK